MEDNRDTEVEKSTHSQYTEAYVGILNAYQAQLSESVNKKNDLKEKFFEAIKFIMYFMVVTFFVVVVLSLILMAMMVLHNSSSAKVLTGSIVSVVSSFVTMVLAIYKLPEIIAQYLFNKEEDKQMERIIENIQKYELDADKAERMRDQANVDAAMNSIISSSDMDLDMHNSDYVDSSLTDDNTNGIA